VWDGWDLVEEYRMPGPAVQARYLHGPSGLVKNLVSNNYYYQDGSGSTSHLASSSGALLEWYRYDLQGTPIFYNAANVQISGSNQGVRHLFTGQQWYSELGLYDLRNRFYSPDTGRFLQPDPIGFAGDATNLYRYCENNPVNWSDPSGLKAGGMVEIPKQTINGSSSPMAGNLPYENHSMLGLSDPAIMGGGGGFFGSGFGGGIGRGGGGAVRPSRPSAIADAEEVVVTGDPVEPPPPQNPPPLPPNPFDSFALNQLFWDLSIAQYRFDWTRMFVRQTFYNRTERGADPDTIAGRTSTGTPLSWAGNGSSSPGIAAVDPHIIPYGSIIITTDGLRFIAADTGGAVVRQVASQGLAPVVDYYSPSQVGQPWGTVTIIFYNGSYINLPLSRKAEFFGGH
jgi:RHS repeat-associated protein